MSRKEFRHAPALVVKAALLLSLLTPAFSQEPTPAPRQDEQDEVVRVNSNLVQVDAVVVDDRGRQVTDLQASDFEIVEDGAARRPEYCHYVAVDGGAAPKEADGRLAAGEVRRSIVFVVANPLIELKNNFIADGRPFDTQPSNLMLSMNVTDTRASSRVLTRFVEVADLSRGDLGTSSLFLSPASDVASAAPPSPPGGDNLSAYTRRAFAAGGTLRYQCYVYNATRDKTHGASSLRVLMTLRRDGVAQAVTPERTVTQSDNPVFVGGDIPLEGMPPGRYTLEASITDGRSRATRTVVSHPFQITD